MFEIKCPKCNVDGRISLVESSYHGPYRCWKCRALFTITIENNVLTACESLDQEELDKQQRIKAMRDRFSGLRRENE